MSELNKIMETFSMMGPGAKTKTKLKGDEDGSEGEDGEQAEEEVKEDEGAIPIKEYDYLLSMSLWSLTEEKVLELQRQMHDKKEEHDSLQKKHIYTLWEEDLDAFEVELTKQEEKDEMSW